MDASFYTAARGAMTEQAKMNVISNNVANTNTVGYKSKRSIFMDLLYYNMHSQERVTTGTGVRLIHTNTDFSSNGITEAQAGNVNFAIEGEGFFMLRDRTNNDITYTRAGNFSISRQRDGTYYLVTDKQKLVLDGNGNPIRYVDGELTAKPGVYTFINTNDMQSVGATEFRPVAKNGRPIRIDNPDLREGYLELSNVDMAKEMSDTVIASRAYSYALKMVQTADEVEQNINSLRQ